MDKPNNHPYRDPGECPACRGIAAEMKSCQACHGTGRKPQAILPFPTIRPTSQSDWFECRCVYIDTPIRFTGTTALCPICGGERRLRLARLYEVYNLILRHQRELRPIDADMLTTQPIGATLLSVLGSNPFGAYSNVVKEFRLYIEPSGHADRYDLFSQDVLRPLGTTARFLIYPDAPLPKLTSRLKQFPQLDAPLWWPLPEHAAMRMWEQRA